MSQEEPVSILISGPDNERTFCAAPQPVSSPACKSNHSKNCRWGSCSGCMNGSQHIDPTSWKPQASEFRYDSCARGLVRGRE